MIKKNNDKLFKEVLFNIQDKDFSYLILNPVQINEVLNFLLIKTLLVDNRFQNNINLYCRNCNDFFDKDLFKLLI